MTKGSKKKSVKFQKVVHGTPGKEEEAEDIYPDKKRDEAASKARRFKEKHSLDSDEELDEEKVEDGKDNVLHEDDIEGQEDETIRNDEGITLTPFNLKDELEEGYFDAQGNYIANKDPDATDQWLESVDWKKVEDKPFKQPKKMEELEEPVLEPVKIMQDMIEIMKPGENVLKCLRRLGGNKRPVSSADRWKKKKQNIEEPIDEKAAEDKANLLKLTGLADDLLQGGDFQIYERTYEQLKYEINVKLSQFQDADKDDELEVAYKKRKLDIKEEGEKKMEPDVDSDDDELEAAFTNSKNTTESTDSMTIGTVETKGKEVKNINTTEIIKDESIVLTSDEVCWFYKLEDNDSCELQGPYTSTVMLNMHEEGKFGDGVYCRKVGSEGSFYNSKRVDFDLYI